MIYEKLNTSRIVFMGTPHFAVPSLDALVKSGRDIALVVTQPDRPAGRGKLLAAPPVKEYCLQNNLPFIQPEKIKTLAFSEQLRSCQTSVFVAVAYGRILTSKILNIPRITLNVHASLLPSWRGASPICRAMAHGDKTTGVSIMKLVEELDAGDVMLQKETAIFEHESMGDLTKRLSGIGAQALIEALDLIEQGKAAFHPQDASRVSFAPPVQTSEAKINWNLPADRLVAHIHAFNPWPGAYFFSNEERIKIWKVKNVSEPYLPLDSNAGTVYMDQKKLFVACNPGWIEILEIQREGKSKQLAQQFIQGYRISKGLQWT